MALNLNQSYFMHVFKDRARSSKRSRGLRTRRKLGTKRPWEIEEERERKE